MEIQLSYLWENSRISKFSLTSGHVESLMKSFKVGIRNQTTIDNRRSPKSIYSKLSSAIIVNDDEKFQNEHQNPDDN